MRLIYFLGLLGLFACNRQPLKTGAVTSKAPTEKQIQVSPQSLQVINTQEFMGDELVLVGAIGIIEGDKIKPAQVFSSYLGKVKKGQVIRLDTIKAVELRLKPGQKASFQLSLFEIEDYQSTKNWVNRFNQVSGVLALPLALTSAENPVAWFLWGMKAGSIGLDWISEIDLKDLLGVSETQWEYDSLRSSTRTGKWVGGRKLLNAYEYQYKIQINVD
jgi:hypothetical protein